MDVILNSIKKMLGMEVEDTSFDTDIMISINSALFAANQLGIGPDTGFFITGVTEKWVDFIGDRTDIEAVKSYVYLKVRLLFDPPSNSFLIEAMKSQIQEFEWRLNVQVDKPVVTIIEEV